tara:strand:- start:9507 stop:10352 length:846 start_codon:yes stop_codon:yes gene_type:complete
MKRIAFISDLFRGDLLGGAESNDHNLIKHLSQQFTVISYKSNEIAIKDIEQSDFVIVSNFVLLSEEVKAYLIKSGSYIIYEHDHKYLRTRDPSKFVAFKAPTDQLINEGFYSQAKAVVVLSEICKKVLERNIPDAHVHNIACSLWSDQTFELLARLSDTPKEHEYCIMRNLNPTKNYHQTVEFCNARNIQPVEIHSPTYHYFLTQMSGCRKFVFLPTVLETFSRICAEAKMLNLQVMTNKNLIGFFSENYSTLQGSVLIEKLREKNKTALKYFTNIVLENT